MAMVCVGCPYFATVQAPPALTPYRSRTHTGEVRPRIWLAHTNAKKGLGATNSRKIELALRLGAKFENERAALPVGDPVGRDRGSDSQQLFDKHEAGKSVKVCTPIFRWEGNTNPVARRQLAAEIDAEAHPRPGTQIGGRRREVGSEERLYLGSKSLNPGGQRSEAAGRRKTIQSTLLTAPSGPALIRSSWIWTWPGERQVRRQPNRARS